MWLSAAGVDYCLQARSQARLAGVPTHGSREGAADTSADEQRVALLQQERGRRLESSGTARSDSFMELEAFSFVPAM